LAEGQVRQEEAVVQHLKQKSVSRLLIAGDEPNAFSRRVYPA
jgi:hypothetical protein